MTVPPAPKVCDMRSFRLVTVDNFLMVLHWMTASKFSLTSLFNQCKKNGLMACVNLGILNIFFFHDWLMSAGSCQRNHYLESRNCLKDLMVDRRYVVLWLLLSTFIYFLIYYFSVLTPYYKEHILYSHGELNEENEDGISTLFYLQKIYPGEFWIYYCIVFVIIWYEMDLLSY